MYRIRIDALMRDKGIVNGYQLARDSGIPETTAYRLLKSDGRVTSFESALVQKLCAFWGKKPMELIEWVDEPSPKKRKAR